MSPLFDRAVVVCLVSLCLSLAGCSRVDEAQAIQQLIADGVQKAQAHDLSGLKELVAGDFIAEPGDYPWAEAKRFVFLGMKRYGNFRIHYPRPSLEIAEDRRHATATVHFLIVNKERLLPGLKKFSDDPSGWLTAVGDNADLYTLTMNLREDDGDWFVYRAQLKHFAGLRGRP